MVGANGITVFTITTLTPGTHNIAASYPGVAGVFLASTSATDVFSIPAVPSRVVAGGGYGTHL